MIFVLGCHQEVFDGPTPFKVYLYPMFLVHIFYTCTKAFCIWYHYIVYFDVKVGTGTVACWFLLIVVVFLVRSTDLVLYPVQGPSWIFASGRDVL